MNFLLCIILYIRILDALSLLATCKTKQKINHKSQKKNNNKNTYKQKYFLWLWKNVDVHASRFSAYQIFDVLSIFNLLFQVNYFIIELIIIIINDDKSTLNENWILVYQRNTWTNSSCLTIALCLLGRKYFIQTHSFISFTVLVLKSNNYIVWILFNLAE